MWHCTGTLKPVRGDDEVDSEAAQVAFPYFHNYTGFEMCDADWVRTRYNDTLLTTYIQWHYDLQQ